jgi:hypothetical protein
MDYTYEPRKLIKCYVVNKITAIKMNIVIQYPYLWKYVKVLLPHRGTMPMLVVAESFQTYKNGNCE